MLKKYKKTTFFYFEENELKSYKIRNFRQLQNIRTIVKIPFRDTTFILFSENYFIKNLYETERTDFMSESFMLKQGLTKKTRTISDVYKFLHDDRKSILFESTTFHNYLEVFLVLKENVQKFFFYNCLFDFHGDLILKDLKILLCCFWINCRIGWIKIELNQYESDDLNQITNSFDRCSFNEFQYYVGDNSKLILQDQTYIDKLITNSEFIRLKNIRIKLFHHTNLNNNNNDFGFDNVTFEFIDFNRDFYLQDLTLDKVNDSSQYIKRFTKGYLNTYKQLLNNDGLFSERKVIKKYIHYLSSRNNMLKRFLFGFNGGYSKILIPFIFTLVIILIKCIVLYFNQYLYSERMVSLVPVFYPINMFKNIIFSNYSLNPSISKIFLFVLEPIYIYSLFSFLTGVKRFLGFKLDL